MKSFLKKASFIFILMTGYKCTFAQLIPLHQNYTNEVNSLYASFDTIQYTAMKPLLLQNHPKLKVSDTEYSLLTKWDSIAPKKMKFFKSLLYNHLLEVHDNDVHLYIDPILSITAGKATDLKAITYLNTRGASVYGQVGKKVQFNLTYFENQGRFPEYVDSFIRANNVVPGQGRRRGFKENSFDFSRSDAYVSYAPSNRFDMVLGYGKNFIGDGYRSLLLSDNSFSYPFLRMHTKFWKINYTVLYNQYSNPRNLINENYQRKFSTIHLLNVDVSKKLEIGIFESIVWQGNDTTSTRGFDLQYLNPILFLRPVEFSLGSTDNAVLGLSAKYKMSKRAFLYGQFILDDINLQQTLKYKEQHLNNKYGIQLGIWTKNLLNVDGLNYRFEYNTVRPFTYGHRKTNQNYTHYNQALAHPLGANFHEVINNFTYRKKRWYGEFHSVFAMIGEDYKGKLYGNNLWGGEAGVPSLGIYTLDGLKTKFGYNQLTIGWTLNKVWNTNIQLQVGNRFRKNDVRSQSETFVNFGIVTNLANYYYDF